jgi:2-oxoglutarate ferredoxin oxidoreductase subunit alpha
MILGDGILGQMMEAVEFKDDYPVSPKPKPWAATGTKGKRAPNIINSLNINPAELEAHNNKLNARYCEITETEARYEAEGIEDAKIVIVAYGTTSRIAQEAIEMCKSEGIAVELIRPVTLWPFPNKAFDRIGEKCGGVLCVEMSTGQMLDDVKIAANGRFPVSFYGRSGGMIPEAEDIAREIRKIGGALA